MPVQHENIRSDANKKPVSPEDLTDCDSATAFNMLTADRSDKAYAAYPLSELSDEDCIALNSTRLTKSQSGADIFRHNSYLGPKTSVKKVD